MKRHRFRWDALLFGLMFLAVVGSWLSRVVGLFDPTSWAYVAAGGLIVAGVAGILATVRRPALPPTEDEPAPPSSSSH